VPFFIWDGLDVVPKYKVARIMNNPPTNIIEKQQWTHGNQDVEYFNDSGNSGSIEDITESRFDLDIIGDYTIYTKLTDGNEYVSVFNVVEENLLLPKLYTDVVLGVVTVSYKLENDNKIAYIPDDTLRRAMNSILGKGSVLDEISVAEVKTIDAFSSTRFQNITDLTGVELLESCTALSLSAPTSSTGLLVTDYTPLIKLGEKSTLTSLNVVIPSQTILNYEHLNQLKGKFPHLTVGYVWNWQQVIYITLDELKYGEVESKIYGVKIDTTNPSPDGALTYTDDAIGFTPLKVFNGVVDYGSWQDIYPFNEVTPIVVKNGVEQYELNKDDFTKKKDGSPADITSGADGDVFSRFSKVWWKFETIGTDLYVKIATAPTEGFKCLAHTVGGVEKDYVYIGAYLGFNDNGKLRSLSGKIPTASKTIGQFRSLAQANGSGYEQMTYYKLLMVQVMTLIITKSRDSQTSIGRGYVDDNTNITNTGGTDTKGMFYGENTGKQQMKLFGIEDVWGNYQQFIDGLVTDSNRNILIGDNGFNDTGSGYTNFGQVSTENIFEYIKNVAGGTETGFIIKEGLVGNISNQYYCDYGELLPSSLPTFGGNMIAKSLTGLFNLQITTEASTVNSNMTVRVSFYK